MKATPERLKALEDQDIDRIVWRGKWTEITWEGYRTDMHLWSGDEFGETTRNEDESLQLFYSTGHERAYIWPVWKDQGVDRGIPISAIETIEFWEQMDYQCLEAKILGLGVNDTNLEDDMVPERSWFWEETGYGIPIDEFIAENPFSRGYNSFSGVDVKATFGDKITGTLNDIKYDITRINPLKSISDEDSHEGMVYNPISDEWSWL